MSDYPMLISNKLHSFRNFGLLKYKIKNKVQPFEGVNFILYDGINVYQIRCILCSLHSLRISSGQILACISPICALRR